MPAEPSQTSPLQSPTAIPPRTSSTGVVTNGTTNRYSNLDSISEGEWMSSGKKKLLLSTTSKHGRNISSIDWTKAKDGPWTQDKERILLGPYDYMAQQPGKDIRKQMITAFNAWLKVPESSLAIITKVVTMLHTASLL
jgi:geranylgeranyl diphosphate synthase type 3